MYGDGHWKSSMGALHSLCTLALGQTCQVVADLDPLDHSPFFTDTGTEGLNYRCTHPVFSPSSMLPRI